MKFDMMSIRKVLIAGVAAVSLAGGAAGWFTDEDDVYFGEPFWND